MKTLREPARETTICGGTDVIVCGAGPAGVAAALAAARCGAKTRVFEANGCLGGVWTAGLLTWMFEMDQPGIPRELSEELKARGAYIPSPYPDSYSYDPEAVKLLLEERLAEAGVDYQQHTRGSDVIKNQDGKIQAVVTTSKSGRQAWLGSSFVDASGDGDLAALSGCSFETGRPGSGECQPMTFMALICVKSAELLSPFVVKALAD